MHPISSKSLFYIDVNEEGTEAAAATAVVIGGRSGPPSFDGTRPFIYLIRDNATGTILFMGRMMDPTEEWTGIRLRWTPSPRIESVGFLPRRCFIK